MVSDPALKSVPQPSATGQDQPSPRARDVEVKQRRVAEFLEDEGYDAVLLETQENFAWFTSGGDNSTGMPGRGTAALFVTPESRAVVADNVQAARLFEEEVDGLGFQLKQSSWYERCGRMIDDLCRGRNVASDTGTRDTVDESEKLSRLRLALTDVERRRSSEVGHQVSHALEATCRNIEPAETEADVASHLAHRLIKRGIAPVVLEVAADDRAARFRRPIFKDNRIERRCVLTVVGRKRGLCAAASRTVCFGEPPEAFLRQFQLASMLDATYIFFSHPGEAAADVFRRAKRIYEKFGCPDEWMLCDQGGVIGYTPSEIAIEPDSQFRLRAGMALSWSPTVGSARSQDTVIIDDQGFEVMTVPGRWPVTTVSVKGHNIDRPGLLIR